MILGFCRKPYPDELLYGYVYSIFRQNGFRSPMDIVLFGVCRKIMPEYAIGLPFLKASIDNVTFPDVDEMMRMMPGDGLRFAECALQPWSPCFPEPASHGLVYVCPECLKADLAQYGEAYLHLSHHIDQRACGIHGTRLMCMPSPGIYQEMKPWEQYKYEECDIGIKIILDHRNEYVWSVCPNCGKRYLEHEMSRLRGTGCPFCNSKLSDYKIIQNMLDKMYGGEYKLVEFLGSLHTAKVEHVPCSTVSMKLYQLLNAKQVECKECKSLLPEYLRRRFDPEEREWVFLDTDEKDRARRRIRVFHRVCGKESYLFMPQFTSKGECGYCPICDNPQQRIEISDVDPEYEVIGDYRNNRESVQIKHRSCGLVFETSKTTFLAGARCPLCTPRYEFQDIQKAMAECCPGWHVRKEPKRGFVSLITPDGDVLSGYSYGAVMANLKAENSTIFPDRVKRWSDPVSLRKTIYDRIAEGTRTKGYWNFADGLDEVTDPSMPGGVSRERRNIVQDMCRDGLIERCGRGCYRTVK